MASFIDTYHLNNLHSSNSYFSFPPFLFDFLHIILHSVSSEHVKIHKCYLVCSSLPPSMLASLCQLLELIYMSNSICFVI